jgi:hypothetical protein
MEFLELQLSETVSLRFHSPLVSSTGGSLLTWIAVLVAAAVGFWRIRTVGSKADESNASSLFTASQEEGQQKVVSVLQTTEMEASLSPSSSVDQPMQIIGTPKVRFMTYFEKEDFIGCCHVEDGEEELIVDAVVEFGHRKVELPQEREEVSVKWEGMVIRRRGDLGWYSYQDMAALNGSVVRLWDGESLSKRNSSIAISSF